MKKMFFWGFLPEIFKDKKTKKQVKDIIDKELELLKKYSDLEKDIDYKYDIPDGLDGIEDKGDKDYGDDKDPGGDDKDPGGDDKDPGGDDKDPGYDKDYGGDKDLDEYKPTSISTYWGTPPPTKFSQTEQFFYYGWEGSSEEGKEQFPMTIRRRERITGYLQQGYTHKQTFLEAWASRDSLVYSRL